MIVSGAGEDKGRWLSGAETRIGWCMSYVGGIPLQLLANLEFAGDMVRCGKEAAFVRRLDNDHPRPTLANYTSRHLTDFKGIIYVNHRLSEYLACLLICPFQDSTVSSSSSESIHYTKRFAFLVYY